MRIHANTSRPTHIIYYILYCPIPTRYCNILQAHRIMLSPSRHDWRLAVGCLSWQSGYLARSARSASSGRIRHCSPGRNPSPVVSSASQSMPICRNVPRTVKSALPAMWTLLGMALRNRRGCQVDLAGAARGLPSENLQSYR